MSTFEHDQVGEVIQNVANRAAHVPGVQGALTKGINAWIESSGQHQKGDYRQASRRLGVAISHIGTAAALGRADGIDPNYGYSITPENILDGHHRSYRYGYVDN